MIPFCERKETPKLGMSMRRLPRRREITHHGKNDWRRTGKVNLFKRGRKDGTGLSLRWNYPVSATEQMISSFNITNGPLNVSSYYTKQLHKTPSLTNQSQTRNGSIRLIPSCGRNDRQGVATRHAWNATN